MLIRTRPASASISFESRALTSDISVSTREKEYVSFKLLPTNESDHLDLDTGEVFQDYYYARLRKKHENLIGAILTVEVAFDESDYQRNSMRYRDEIRAEFFHQPTTIFFTVFVAPTAFRQLVDTVRNGLLPDTITIDFEIAPLSSLFNNPQEKRTLEYGWEPDGSGMVWHNNEQANRAIPIESVKFDFAVAKPRHDEKTNQLLPLPDEPPVRTNEQIASIQIMLAEMSKHLRWATIGIIALAILIAIWMVRHI